MDNLWHPPLSVRAALARGNNKVLAARKRQSLQDKAQRAHKRAMAEIDRRTGFISFK